jgi:ABC-type uncharacterized transport system involved in gliding motility auxiliary subunit
MVQRILNIIGWVGTALVFVAVAIRLSLWAGIAQVPPAADRWAVYAAITGLVFVLLYAAGQWRDVLAFFSHRQARYGAIATVSVFVVLGIVIAINYLSAKQNKRWDLTENQQFALSEQTVKVLRSLDSPVKFTVFDRSQSFDTHRSRFDEYAYHSKQVAVEYVDPDAKPMQAKEFEIQTYGTIVVDYKGRRERITSGNEQDVTNALIKAVSGRERTVYFLQGHGEKDPTSTERDGYSAVVETLRRDNYKIEKLPLAQQKDVPEDATVVVIAGPTSDLLPQEIEAIERYLGRAGKLMVLVDPAVGGQGELPNLEGLLKEWAITLGRNIVVDVSGMTNEPSLAVAIGYPGHAITERFNTLTIYPLARSVETGGTGAGGGRTAQPLVQTSPRSWAESNLKSLGEAVSMDEAAGDKVGPVTVAAAVSAPAEQPPPIDPKAKPEDAPKPETRVVVFGDSDFPSNAYGGVEGNPNLFANAVSWLAQQENLIAIRPKEASDRRLTITANQQRGLFLLTLFGIPAAVFAAGIYTWSRRRS